MECARNGTVNFGVPEQATDTFKRAFECPKRRVPSSFNRFPLNSGGLDLSIVLRRGFA
jgi:hypothetical protein